MLAMSGVNIVSHGHTCCRALKCSSPCLLLGNRLKLVNYFLPLLFQSVWTFGLWTTGGSLIEWYCIDAYAEHGLLHPGIVREWSCWDEATQAHTKRDYLITTCCTCCNSTTVTPSPATSSASASPTTSVLAPVATLAPATPTITPITPAPATPSTPPPTKRLTPSPVALWTSAPLVAGTLATTSPSSDGSVGEREVRREPAHHNCASDLIFEGDVTG